MDGKLNRLLKRCKFSVHIVVNRHRDYYMTAADYIEEDITAQLMSSESPVDEYLKHRDKMIETDTIVDIQFFPDTAGGSYTVYHYSMENALDECLDLLGL